MSNRPIIGVTVGTPQNPNVIRRTDEEIVEVVNAALAEAKESGEFNGVDGLNAEMYSHQIYRVYSLADVERLCASRAITTFYIINCGQPFDYVKPPDYNITVNTGDIYRVSSNNGLLYAITYLDNNTVSDEEGTVIEWYQPDAENEGVYISRYTAVLHGKNGKSAYQTAIENGFEGTEADWAESFKNFATEDYVDEKIASLSSALNTFVLTDKSTEIAYELCIIDGKLTLTETVSGPMAVNTFVLTDKNTNITYELSVIDGKLTLMEQGG